MKNIFSGLMLLTPLCALQKGNPWYGGWKLSKKWGSQGLGFPAFSSLLLSSSCNPVS